MNFIYKFVRLMVLLALGFCAAGAKDAALPQQKRRLCQILEEGALNPSELDALNGILGFGCGEVDARHLSVGLSPQNRPQCSAQEICEGVNAHGYAQKYYCRPFRGVCTDFHGLRLTHMSILILDKLAVAEYLAQCAVKNNNSYLHNAKTYYQDQLIALIKRVEVRMGISKVDALYKEQRTLREQLLSMGV